MKVGTARVSIIPKSDPDQDKQSQPKSPLSQQGNDGRPNPSSNKNPGDAQQVITPNTPPKIQSTGKLYDTRYHNGLDPDPSKI